MRRGGFTLVEILVALGIASLLLGVILSTTLGHRRLYVLDQNRTAANQNLRAALDILVADLRQAGERLPLDFPAVEVRNGTELVLRRNLFDVVLSLCDRNGISGNQDNTRTTSRWPIGILRGTPPRNTSKLAGSAMKTETDLTTG